MESRIAELHRQNAQDNREAAQRWIEIHDKVESLYPAIAVFCLNRAQDDLNHAQHAEALLKEMNA